MKYLAVILISFIMISGLAVFAESAPAGVDIKGLQVQLKKIQETGTGLRMILFFEKNKEFADAGIVFADMYQDSLADLETESKNTVETFFGGKDTAQALDKAIRYIGSLKSEDQAAYNLFAEYLLEKMGKTAPAELKKLSDKISGYEIENASVDLKDRGLLEKFKEWYLKRYDDILEKLVINKDHKKFKKERKQILVCIDIWDKFKGKKNIKKVTPETEEAYLKARNKAYESYYTGKYSEAITGYLETYSIWPEQAIFDGMNYRVGLCHEKLGEYDKAMKYYTESIYKEKNFYMESYYGIYGIFIDIFEHSEINIRNAINCFDRFLKAPPNEDILGETYTKEEFSVKCLESIKDFYDLLCSTTAITETKIRYKIEAIEYHKSVRDIFLKIIARKNIQDQIIRFYEEIQQLYGDGNYKKEYFLEIIRECKYAIENSLFPDANNMNWWHRIMGENYIKIAVHCSLSKKEKVIYYIEAAKAYEEGAIISSPATNSGWDLAFASWSSSDAYMEAFNYSDSIESKYELCSKSIDVIAKHEKRISSGDAKNTLINKQIEIIRDMIPLFAMCDSVKTENLFQLFTQTISYSSEYMNPADENYPYIKASEVSGYLDAATDFSQGTCKVNTEYLAIAEGKAKEFLEGNYDLHSKEGVKQSLIQIHYYFGKYDDVISECQEMLGGNSYNVKKDFLYQWIGNSYREKSSTVSGSEATEYQEKADINYKNALANSSSIYSQLAVTKDQALLMARQGKCRQALSKYLELINFMDEQDYIYIYVYHFKMLAKELFKIAFTPDILDLSENDEQTYTASIAFSDGTTAETVTAATGWKWSIEGNGTIIEQNANVMKYKAGKDSSSDIITTECNVDLKQVLKIRGDFDTLISIKGELKTIIQQAVIISRIVKPDGTFVNEIPSDDPKILEYNESVQMFTAFQAKIDNQLQWFLGYKEDSPPVKANTIPTTISVKDALILPKKWDKQNGELTFEWYKIIADLKHAQYPWNVKENEPSPYPWYTIIDQHDHETIRAERYEYHKINCSIPDTSYSWISSESEYGTNRFGVSVQLIKNGIPIGQSISPGRFETFEVEITPKPPKPVFINDIIPEDYEGNRGIKNTVHRISKKANISSSPLVNCILSYINVPWIYGSHSTNGQSPAKSHQTDMFVGFDCADLAVGGYRVLKKDSLKIEYLSANALAKNHPSVIFPISPNLINSDNPNAGIISQKIRLFKKDEKWIFINEATKEVTLNFGCETNNIQIGDLVMIDWKNDGTFDHTTLIYSDEKDSANQIGTFDPNDLLIFAGHHEYKYFGNKEGKFSGIRGTGAGKIEELGKIENDNFPIYEEIAYDEYHWPRFVIRRFK